VLALVRELMEKSRRGELKPPDELQKPKDNNRRKREEALKAWRAEKATARKVTPSVVLPNPVFDALLSRPPASLEELSAVPYIGEKRVQLYGASLLELLAQHPVQG
jgi:ribonuclease D